MNKIKQIDQFTPNVAYGDSVSNGLLFTQKILKNLGFISNIYICATYVDLNFKHDVFSIDEYSDEENQLLLYHHSIGHYQHDKVMEFKAKKILVYHNITPSHFFKDEKNLQILCDLGRAQLKQSPLCFIGSYADSLYNCEELIFYNYKSPIPLPLLVDLNKDNTIIPNEKIVEKYSNSYNILFVGRIVQNKCQHQLIDVIYILKEKGYKNIRLFIVGGASQVEYLKYLQNYIINLNLQHEVIITGKVNDQDLAAYYKSSDLYLSLSEHEGFGMPFIEAMKYDIPVLTFNVGGISSTVVKESLLEKKSASFVAEEIIKIQNNPFFRVKLLKKQKNHLKSFIFTNMRTKFMNYLSSFNISIPCIPIEKESVENSMKNYQIEGPFDSSYSLSIVNRNVADSLTVRNNVKLYSTEGYGDFLPNLEYIDNSTKSLFLKTFTDIDITIRNTFPPRTNSMRGYQKIIGPYGWEESKFPQQYVEWFNTKATMILAVSSYVKNVLKDNGVSIPIYTTGNIVEDILNIETKPLKYNLPDTFNLLHISSGFPRKGLDILLKAFDSIDDDKISLIIKTFPNPHNNIVDLLSKLNYTIKIEYEDNVMLYSKNNKNILLINKDIDQEQIKYLYEHSDVLVAPSFGEGFGLPLAEAMLLNLPVITTGYGGQTDFCNEKTASLIDFDFEYTNSHLKLENSFWAVPKVSSLKEEILLVNEQVLSCSDILSNKLKNAKKNILKNYSSEKIAKKIEKSIANYPLEKPIKKIALFSTYNTKCGIAIYSKYLISSFEDEVTIFANKKDITSQDTLKTIRCWQDSRDTKEINVLKQNLIENKITTLIIQYNFSFIPLFLLSELLLFCNDNKIETHLFLHSTQDVITSSYSDSFHSIYKEMMQATKIYTHTLKDLNYLKNQGIYRNTYLTTHGINTNIDSIQNSISNEIPILATFGFLLPHKGILELVDVAQKLHQDGLKVNLLLLTSLHTAEISKKLLKILEEKIKNSSISKYITVVTDFQTEEEIISKLSQADKILFNYQNTQESSSAAVRTGLLAKKEVITTPLDIFDDVSSIVTQTKNTSIEEMVKTIKNSLKTPYNTKKHKLFLEQNSWKRVSKTFYNSLS